MTLLNDDFERLEQELTELFSPDISADVQGEKNGRIEQILRRVESVREGMEEEAVSMENAAPKQDDQK